MHIPHIFVAENSEYNQILFAKMLDQLGYSTSTAGNGKQLLELLETSIPNLLLLDIEMPEMDGFEIIRMIRQGNTGADRNLPVVALINNYKESDASIYKEAGFSGWMAKPFTRLTLKEKVEIALTEKKNNPSDLPGNKEIITAEEPMYSLKYLREGSDGDEEFLKMMIGMFLESTPIAIQLMNEGLLQADWDKIRQEAHKLRSHLRYFGMIKAALLTEEIERTSANNPSEPILKELIGKVDLICQTCMLQLREEFHL
jgi:CheY-like chemotaxis protein/HPt (histidine-containing phosphotransfer) domain-containing protein